MDKDYTVVSAEDKGEAQYGARRYQIKFEGDEEASGFSKFPIKPGDVLFGHIEVNGAYRNWKFGKRASAPAPSAEFAVSNAEVKNLINLKVLPALAAILARLPKPESEYPEMNETNNASPF